MTWTLHLTAGALPGLLAVLLALRETLFLWPRRREAAAPPFLVLSVLVGVWAALHTLAVISPDPLSGSLALARLDLSVGFLAPVAWMWVGLEWPDRSGILRRPLPLGVFLLSLAATALVWSAWAEMLVRPGAGAASSSVRWGGASLAMLGLRLLAVGVGTASVVRVLGASSAPTARRWSPLLAATAALAPAAMPSAWPGAPLWLDLTPAGFGVGLAILGAGLARHRLLELGPVARHLVMVEMGDPIVVFDGRGRIVDANRAARDGLGLHPYGTVPLELGTAWAASRAHPDAPATVRLAPAGDGEGDEEGERRTFEVSVTPLASGGASGHAVLLLRDITERERMERELRRATEALRATNAELVRLARTDPLTGIANRRHFLATLEGELDRSTRYHRPVALLMLDLDHFKGVNDSFGHAAGDGVLRALADALKSVSRDVDLPARLGGEEFALLLPETDTGGAAVVAERLRRRVEATRHTAPGGADFGVTVSIGVAGTLGGKARGEQLVQAADEALYRAKAAGRNRVEIAGDSATTTPA